MAASPKVEVQESAKVSPPTLPPFCEARGVARGVTSLSFSLSSQWTPSRWIIMTLTVNAMQTRRFLLLLLFTWFLILFFFRHLPEGMQLQRAGRSRGRWATSTRDGWGRSLSWQSTGSLTMREDSQHPSDAAWILSPSFLANRRREQENNRLIG